MGPGRAGPGPAAGGRAGLRGAGEWPCCDVAAAGTYGLGAGGAEMGFLGRGRVGEALGEAGWCPQGPDRQLCHVYTWTAPGRPMTASGRPGDCHGEGPSRKPPLGGAGDILSSLGGRRRLSAFQLPVPVL